MALVKLVIESGANGHSTFSLPYPTHVNTRAMAGGAAESITVPAGAKFVVFSATADFWVDYTGTAADISDLDDGTGHEINPVIRNIEGLSTLSVYSDDANSISASFYS